MNGEISKQKISDTLNKIVNLFKTGNVPEAIIIVTFPRYDVPSNKWSLSNRLLMMISGASDARGFKQWQEAGRYVKKGEKAFYILAPRMVKRKNKPEEENEEQKEDKKEYICTGFIPIPVFGAEQTEGEPLEYQKIELPNLPLLDKAKEWSIDVKGVCFQDRYYGYYQHGEDKERIMLATPHEKTFFHELSHAAHWRLKGKLEIKQDPYQEIVAELSAQVIAQLVGRSIESTLGNTFEYIQNYSAKMNKSVEKACLMVLGEVEKVLDLVLSVKEEQNAVSVR